MWSRKEAAAVSLMSCRDIGARGGGGEMGGEEEREEQGAKAVRRVAGRASWEVGTRERMSMTSGMSRERRGKGVL